jgi:DNA-binding transcriptional MocR family regulator
VCATSRTGSPDPKLLPPLAPVLRSIDGTHTMYGCALMVPELARVARRDLQRDGVAVDALAIVSGGMDGIERVLAVDLKAGDRVVIEDPGFTSVIDLLTAQGLKIVPCAVDDRGLIPQALERALETPARAVVITPRAQNPTGAAMDEARARELKRIVRAHADLLVIEDDHGAEVAGTPLYTLCDGSLERWAFVRSVSKSLGPDLRIAFLSGDAETVARVEGRQMMGMRWVSHLLQRTAAALWSEKGTTALLRKAERTYTTRRKALLDALGEHGIEAHGCSGMNVWIPVPEETAVAQALLDRGWAVIAGERFRIESAPGIRVTISTLEPAEAEKFAADLAGLLDARGLSTNAEGRDERHVREPAGRLELRGELQRDELLALIGRPVTVAEIVFELCLPAAADPQAHARVDAPHVAVPRYGVAGAVGDVFENLLIPARADEPAGVRLVLRFDVVRERVEIADVRHLEAREEHLRPNAPSPRGVCEIGRGGGLREITDVLAGVERVLCSGPEVRAAAGEIPSDHGGAGA